MLLIRTHNRARCQAGILLKPLYRKVRPALADALTGPYELFLQLEDIAHRTTRVKRPQSNGIIERFHRTLLDEHFRVEGRKTWFETIEEMQVVLDAYLIVYNTKRPHQGRGMKGRTPAAVFMAGLPSAAQISEPKKKEKIRHGNQPETNPQTAAI